eukprot:SM003881S14630  [mRNA]  locus=s3881:711:1141:+ [translate_table: standard]
MDGVRKGALKRYGQAHAEDLCERPGGVEAGHRPWQTWPPVNGLASKPLNEIQPAAAESPVYIHRQGREFIPHRHISLLAAGRLDDRVPCKRRRSGGVGGVDAVCCHHISDDAGTAAGRDGDQVSASRMGLAVRAQLNGHD